VEADLVPKMLYLSWRWKHILNLGSRWRWYIPNWLSASRTHSHFLNQRLLVDVFGLRLYVH